jgi:hypothetical protein
LDCIDRFQADIEEDQVRLAPRHPLPERGAVGKFLCIDPAAVQDQR